MSADPVIIERSSQPYVAIARSVTMAELGTELPPLGGQLFRWLELHDQEPVGPPFWKYNIIDMDGKLNVEVGVPIATVIDGDDSVTGATLPAGRYATVTYVGDPAGLLAVTRALLEWAEEQELSWDAAAADDGEHWAARLEEYLTDPADEPDRSKWQTRLAFRLR